MWHLSMLQQNGYCTTNHHLWQTQLLWVVGFFASFFCLNSKHIDWRCNSHLATMKTKAT
jgi:hypothetical protein